MMALVHWIQGWLIPQLQMRAARIILQLGQGTEMAKIDIASAFRLIPVHPDDRYPLGMKWNDQV